MFYIFNILSKFHYLLGFDIPKFDINMKLCRSDIYISGEGLPSSWALTCKWIIGIKLWPAVDAGRVQWLNAERLQEVPQLLYVTVLTVQSHLQLDAHLALFWQLLQRKNKQVLVKDSERENTAAHAGPAFSRGTG